METVVSVFQWLLANGPTLLTAVTGLLTAVIAVCLFIPGEQPEKALQAIVDFLKKFSAKPEALVEEKKPE